MNAFMQQLSDDVDNIFMNPDEFADVHTVNGESMTVVVDTHRLAELKTKSQYAEELYLAETLLFVRPRDLGYRPAKGSDFEFDGHVYQVLEVSGEMLYRIILGAVE